MPFVKDDDTGQQKLLTPEYMIVLIVCSIYVAAFKWVIREVEGVVSA